MIYASLVEYVSFKSEVQIIVFHCRFFVDIEIILSKIMNV